MRDKKREQVKSRAGPKRLCSAMGEDVPARYTKGNPRREAAPPLKRNKDSVPVYIHDGLVGCIFCFPIEPFL